MSTKHIDQDIPITSITASLMSGVKDLVLEVSRQSDKQMEIATAIACERAKTLLDWCVREYGTKYEMPEAFFPNAPKCPVPNQAVKTTVTKQDEKPAEEIKPIRSMKLLTAEIIRRLEKYPFVYPELASRPEGRPEDDRLRRRQGGKGREAHFERGSGQRNDP